MEKQRATSYISEKAPRSFSIVARPAINLKSTRLCSHFSKQRNVNHVTRQITDLTQAISTDIFLNASFSSENQSNIDKALNRAKRPSFLFRVENSYKNHTGILTCRNAQGKENQYPSFSKKRSSSNKPKTPLREVPGKLQSSSSNKFYDKLDKVDDQLSKFYSKYFK